MDPYMFLEKKEEDLKKFLALSSVIENAPYELTRNYNPKITGNFLGNSNSSNSSNCTGSSNSSSHSSNSSSSSASGSNATRTLVSLEDGL